MELPIHAALQRALEQHRVNGGGEELFQAERKLYAENAANITGPLQEFFRSCGITTNEQAENGERRARLFA